MRLKTKKKSSVGKKLKFTDLGNAKRLIRQHGDDIRYCYALGKWFVWDAQHWRLDEGDQIIGKAKATVKAMYREAAEMEDTVERQKLAKWAAASENRAKLTNMIFLAQSEVPVAVKALDAHPWLLGLPNGVIDLKTGKLRAPSRDDLITKQAPVEYDRHANCQTWLNFLDRIFAGNKGLITFIQRAAGYSLTGDTREQCLFVLWGTGANGKSTFLNTMRALLGDYGTQADIGTFMSRDRTGSTASPDLARLRGARLVVAMEAEDGHRLAEALIKQVTGGDMLAARHLYAEHFEFQPAFKLFFGTNYRPRIRGTDYAIWRRLNLVPFKVTIPPAEQDRRLLGKLINELPGILNWAVEGCLAWQRDGLQVPKEVKNATQAYRQGEDLLGQFITECCTTEPNKRVLLKALYKRYADWSTESGSKPENKTRFLQRLEERDAYQKSKGHAGALWIDGLELRDEEEKSQKSKFKYKVIPGGKA